MNVDELTYWLDDYEANSAFVEISQNMLAIVPANFDLEVDTWDILPWLTKVGNSSKRNIYFDRIQQYELKILCKLWVLHARLVGNISSLGSARNRICVFEALSNVLGPRKFKTLKTEDFYTAERWFCDKFNSPYRFASCLQQASNWLSVSFNLPLNYKNRLVNPMVHGRYGTEAGRENKLIPNEIIRDMLEARHKDNLIAKDKFFISVLAIFLGTGFRVGELATLPANCLLKLNGYLHLLHYPEKGGKPVPRPIHPMLSELVEDAVNNIINASNEARKVAKRLHTSSQLDWMQVIVNRNAFRYFTEKWAHAWTKDPTHRMINPDGIWCNKAQCFIDIIGTYEAYGFNKVKAAQSLGMGRSSFANLLKAQEAAQRGEPPISVHGKKRGQLRTSWDNDTRMLSMLKFEKHCGISLHKLRRENIQDIIDCAQALQLKGQVYPEPVTDESLEISFQRKLSPLLKDKSGKVLLYQDEALLIIQKYALSEHRSTREGDYISLTESHIMRWLCGEKRSLGTGNNEDSVFSRLNIIDPRTGEIAKSTSHNIRHWLNTVYQNGGMTEDQIALIFNRKNNKHNAIYDQTSSTVRTTRLKQAVRDKMVIGQVTDSYNLLAEFSREDAEDYLEAVLRMVNPMPHGVCTLDWATTPCPHHLSCFSCSDERPCEHLIVDPLDEPAIKELNRMQHESDLIVIAITSQDINESPTLDHFKRISRNVGVTIDQIRKLRSK